MGRKTLLTLLLSLLLIGCSEKQVDVYPLYAGDNQMWEHIFKQGPAQIFERAPLGVILPHHMVVQYELAKFYKGLGEVKKPKQVFIIGPNHYETGKNNIQSCLSCVFHTVDGEVGSSQKFKDDLIFEDKNFSQEHSIFTHVPYVKRTFPDAEIVPIMLKFGSSEEELMELVEWLNGKVNAEDLVIASVDFSHYVPVESSKLHDIFSWKTIENFDYQNIYDMEIDSPPSIFVMLKLMDLRGYEDAERLANTNLQDFKEERVIEGTSHQFIYFGEGEGKKNDDFTILYLNKLGLAELGVIDSWRWTLDKDSSARVFNYPVLENLRGLEDRFLAGVDQLVFESQNQFPTEENVIWGVARQNGNLKGWGFPFEIIDGKAQLKFDEIFEFLPEKEMMSVQK